MRRPANPGASGGQPGGKSHPDWSRRRSTGIGSLSTSVELRLPSRNSGCPKVLACRWTHVYHGTGLSKKCGLTAHTGAPDKGALRVLGGLQHCSLLRLKRLTNEETDERSHTAILTTCPCSQFMGNCGRHANRDRLFPDFLPFRRGHEPLLVQKRKARTLAEFTAGVRASVGSCFGQSSRPEHYPFPLIAVAPKNLEGLWTLGSGLRGSGLWSLALATRTDRTESYFTVGARPGECKRKYRGQERCVILRYPASE
jgi:hypothetical protein